MSNENIKVFVAMSGGVDSSVSAALLREQGFDVTGVFMQGWSNPHFECRWAEDRRDAARAAARVGIPFKALDFSREYGEKVVAYLIDEYKNGRTPNPDVACNKDIKFGLFLEWALARGADYIATGHYVRRKKAALFAGIDKNKDQSYFLWALARKQITKCLFPVGGLTKPEVRSLARKFNLHVSEKKDSQGICFVGEGNIADFLKSRIKTTKGEIRTADGGRIGEHEGLELFTIGQRHGIGSPGGGTAYYVAQKQAETGTLVVAKGGSDPILYKKEVAFENANWQADVPFPFECKARIRYRGALAACRVEDGIAVFSEPQRAVAAGQSVVFYDGERLLGGAVIK